MILTFSTHDETMTIGTLKVLVNFLEHVGIVKIISLGSGKITLELDKENETKNIMVVGDWLTFMTRKGLQVFLKNNPFGLTQRQQSSSVLSAAIQQVMFSPGNLHGEHSTLFTQCSIYFMDVSRNQ